MRRLIYLTGTRADYGLMLPTLRRIASTPGLEIAVVVTGMHLSDKFGRTEREVEASAVPIAARIPLPIDDDSGEGMGLCAGAVTTAMARFLADYRPDALLVLGDRWEMVAAALPALLASVPVVHLCGGERSGTVDESLRHAVSKLAHLHLVATEEAEERLTKMGEDPWRIHNVGAPGLVGIRELASTGVDELGSRYGFDPARPYALVLFHSVVQDAEFAGLPVAPALRALASKQLQVICLEPNADHGTGNIRAALQEAAGDGVSLVTHMPREDYLSAMRHAVVLVGNSSSGIIEAASFGTPAVNVGDRQDKRARNANVIDADGSVGSISAALDEALAGPRGSGENIYGAGDTDRRIAELLCTVDFEDPRLLKKQISY